MQIVCLIVFEHEDVPFIAMIGNRSATKSVPAAVW